MREGLDQVLCSAGYATNSRFVNHCLITFLQRIADPQGLNLEPMLHQVFHFRSEANVPHALFMLPVRNPGSAVGTAAACADLACHVRRCQSCASCTRCCQTRPSASSQAPPKC